MICNTLINILDDFNDDVAYISRFVKPKKIINIVNRREQSIDVLTDMSTFLSKQLEDIDIIEKSYTDPLQLKKILKSNIEQDTIINISSGDNLSAVISHQAMIDNNVSLIYMDVRQEKIYKINNKKIQVTDYNSTDFYVDDYISITGGKVVTDETFSYMTKDYEEIINIILGNYALWVRTMDYIRNNLIRQHNNTVVIREGVKNNQDIKELFNKFSMMGCVKNIHQDRDNISITFKNEDIRNYILSGTWLEYFTYNIVKGNSRVCDVRTGIRFLWDEDKMEVENEMDVMAVAKSSLICISCKDTKRYNSGALNELDIYSERLGGSTAKKILVATKPSRGQYVDERANEMGIKLILFDGDVDKFKRCLNDIINT